MGIEQPDLAKYALAHDGVWSRWSLKEGSFQSKQFYDLINSVSHLGRGFILLDYIFDTYIIHYTHRVIPIKFHLGKHSK